ncbi:MAG: TIGR01777 family oxidoreductase [Chloroflexota bacterium]
MKVIVAGATGFIGRALVGALRERGDDVVVLTTHVQRAERLLGQGVTVVSWNPPEPIQSPTIFTRADAVVNLAGASIIKKRWDIGRKREIMETRVQSTRAIVNAMAAHEPRPKVLVNASAVGLYGSRGDEELTEQSASGTDFLPDVVREWEAAAREAAALGVRVVLIRSGVVLGKGGGALSAMAMPYRLFVGGVIGPPRAWFPWIHLEDEIGLILYALDNPAVRGPINAVAPNPVSMEMFSRDLGRAMHRPTWVPFLDKALPLALGERSESLLASLRVLPEAATTAGYQFRHPEIEEALTSLFS